MKEEEINKFLDNAKWKNAKTYEKFAPHSYILIKEYNKTEQNIIKELGNIIYKKGNNTLIYKKWNREWNAYFYDGHIYWFHAKRINNDFVDALYEKNWIEVTIDKYMNDVKILNKAKWYGKY